MTDPGGSAYPFTPHAITAIRAVELWLVFVMALHSARVTQGGGRR